VDRCVAPVDRNGIRLQFIPPTSSRLAPAHAWLRLETGALVRRALVDRCVAPVNRNGIS
jgi:hypothetical protein